MMHDAPVSGFPGVLGLEFAGSRQGSVIGRMRPAKEHFDGSDAWREAVVVALADAVVAHASGLRVPIGVKTRPLHSEIHFFQGSRHGELAAETVALQSGSTTMKWETTVRDEEGHCLAVVIQTRLVVGPDASTSARSPTAGAAEQGIDDEPLRPDQDASASPGLQEDPAAVPSTQDLRRAQILRAAFKVIAQKGFSSASTREIAQEAGMSVPAMYQYVRSKDELLEAIFSNYLSTVESSVQRSTNDAGSATAKLRAAITENMTQFDRFQGQIRLMNRETKALRPEVRQRVKQHLLAYVELFRGILDEGVASGEFRQVDTGVYANFIPLLCDVWPLRGWALGSRDVGAVRDAIIDLMLRALSPARGREA
jgi:AcrR family transcriptional regulator/acyl-coenzyme A thioesterase PaaI-like protein